MKKKEKKENTGKKKGLVQRYGKGVLKENIQIYGMMLPTLLLILIFCYIPMYGLIIAFQDYVPGSAFLGPEVKWVGLKWFQKFISGHYFSRLIRNTLVLSSLNLLFGFTAPILIVSAGSVLFCAPKHFHFADPHLRVEMAEEGVLKIYASSFAKSVEIKNGDDTLLLEDNYFDMNPGCRSIRVLEGKPENLQVRSVYDIR